MAQRDRRSRKRDEDSSSESVLTPRTKISNPVFGPVLFASPFLLLRKRARKASTKLATNREGFSLAAPKDGLMARERRLNGRVRRLRERDSNRGKGMQATTRGSSCPDIVRSAAVCEASAAARQCSPTRCGWVCDHSRAPRIFRGAKTGAGQDCTDLAAAVQLRLRAALACKHCRVAMVADTAVDGRCRSSIKCKPAGIGKCSWQHDEGCARTRGQMENDLRAAEQKVLAKRHGL